MSTLLTTCVTILTLAIQADSDADIRTLTPVAARQTGLFNPEHHVGRLSRVIRS